MYDWAFVRRRKLETCCDKFHTVRVWHFPGGNAYLLQEKSYQTFENNSRNYLQLQFHRHYESDKYSSQTRYNDLNFATVLTHIPVLTKVCTEKFSPMKPNSTSWSSCDWQIIQRQHKASFSPSNWAVSQMGAGQRSKMRTENSLSTPQVYQGTQNIIQTKIKPSSHFACRFSAGKFDFWRV